MKFLQSEEHLPRFGPVVVAVTAISLIFYFVKNNYFF